MVHNPAVFNHSLVEHWEWWFRKSILVLVDREAAVTPRLGEVKDSGQYRRLRYASTVTTM
jgi:hypothetical protein